MSDFKPGDKVRCVSSLNNLLKTGEIYTVDFVQDTPDADFIFLKEVQGGFYPERFVKVVP